MAQVPRVSELSIVDMTSHSSELVHKGGLSKEVKIVVKGSPFHMVLGVVGRAVNFARIQFNASLVYDCEPAKSVDFVKTSPMEFKYSPNSAGDRLEVELRIKVLTSQHEDMLFKVHIHGVDPITKAEFPGLFLVSPPIKVISKPEQLKKRQAPQAHQQQPAPKKQRAVPAAAASDSVADAVQRLEASQLVTNRLLERLLSAADCNARAAPLKREPTSPAEEFEAAFLSTFRAFQQLRSDDKADAVRRVMRTAPPSDVDSVAELVDLVASEGLVAGSPSSSLSIASLPSPVDGGSSGCVCADCPHKRELERVDQFYQRFLENGVGLGGSPDDGSDLALPLDADTDFSSSFLAFA
eukprot:TRINITY_DN4890_c0_g1_i1.p1 TRINITY_DN4890_c0_g1~~TRINITY_DN4890_c0_g1_i1.p1  ORF type:complete len:387 (+),score=104.88 TRINITY_DN4890_c0_g1_i1:104-1162(+)